ncbi:tyrosine-type recombinase/integrase [Acholeplasma laidlawii]|uniref:tyrosine-type recombinase/integrase n=1 Tax=Acholeplasma laidlawii TaxID=2148 RepID=UPI0025418110|nr:tyrosine-type recombinase/integrase [Acholeplasma laidlawii]
MTENIINNRRLIQTFKPTLSKEDAKQLLLTMEQSRQYIWHCRDYALIYLMLTTALRSVEVRRAKIKDITSIGDTYIIYILGKGRSSKDSYVKLTPSVKTAIDTYLALRKDGNPYLFISHSFHTDTLYLSRNALKDILKRVLKVSSLQHLKLTPHSLRHTAATLNFKSGAKLEDIRLQLRHSDITTTSIYVHEETTGDENDIEHFIWNTPNE